MRHVLKGWGIALSLLLIAGGLGGPVAAQERAERATTLVDLLVEARGGAAGGQTRVVLAVRGVLRGYDLVAGAEALTIHLNNVQPAMEHTSKAVVNSLVRRWSVAPTIGSAPGVTIELRLVGPVSFIAKRIPQGLELTLTQAEPRTQVQTGTAPHSTPAPAALPPPAPEPEPAAPQPVALPPAAPEPEPVAPSPEPAAGEAAQPLHEPGEELQPAPARMAAPETEQAQQRQPTAAPQPEPATEAAPLPATEKTAPEQLAAPPRPVAQPEPQISEPPIKAQASKRRAAATAAPPAAQRQSVAPAAASQAAKTEGPTAAELGYTGAKISLDFHKAEITNILRAIAEVSGLNIIASDDVKGSITIRLNNVPWDQALDVVLKVKALVKQREGNILRILTVGSLKAEGEARRAEEEAEAKARLAKARATKAEQEIVAEQPLTEKLFPILYADAEQIKANLEPFLSKDRSGTPRGFINVNSHTNTLIMRDTEQNLHEMEQIVKRLDKPTPQVIIEARIVEATLDFARDLGVQWGVGLIEDELRLRGGLDPATGSAINLPAVGASSALDLTLGNLSNTQLLDLRLSAFESNGKARIITLPRISTLDNKEAVIQRGDRIPIRVLNQQGVTSTQFIDANLTLTVTPHVTLDNYIAMKISVNLDEPDFSRTSVDGIPTIVTRNARTQALVEDGHTTVIGGLLQKTISDVKNQVPGISKIPIFGRLFRRKTNAEQSRELLIFISPKIVRRRN